MKAVDPTLHTAPPRAVGSGLSALRKAVSTRASGWLLPLVQRVAREHIGGETLDDALCVARRLAAEGIPNTLGFWDTPDYSAREVADLYLAAVARAAAGFPDSYISIKPPALRFDPRLAAELAAAAATHRIRLHCDSHGPDVADRSGAMIDAMLGRLPASLLGTTLPGRWARSLEDADCAVDRGLPVRVVKGQWPDPADPGRDLQQGLLEVVERLAGRARHVSVASHDAPLVAEAIGRLRAAGTPCDLEVIHGGPKAQAMRWAQDHGVGVRIYVAFGKGFIPNVIRVLRRDPRLAWRIARGFLASPG